MQLGLTLLGWEVQLPIKAAQHEPSLTSPYNKL